MAVLCHAQPEVGTLSIQPKVGINVANVTDDDISKPRVGVAGGIELQHQIISRLGISYGILYSMQGAKEKVNNVSATLKTDYLAVPILANVYLFKGLALKTGIQPAFNVIDKGTLSSEGHSSTGSISNTTNEIKPFDFGIPFGLYSGLDGILGPPVVFRRRIQQPPPCVPVHDRLSLLALNPLLHASGANRQICLPRWHFYSHISLNVTSGQRGLLHTGWGSAPSPSRTHGGRC